RERGTNGDVAGGEGAIVARGAGDLPGDAGEGGGEVILRVGGEADEEGALVEAGGGGAGGGGAEGALAEEAAESGGPVLRGREALHAADAAARVEEELEARGGQRVDGELVVGEVRSAGVGEAKDGVERGGIGLDVEREDRGHGPSQVGARLPRASTSPP